MKPLCVIVLMASLLCAACARPPLRVSGNLSVSTSFESAIESMRAAAAHDVVLTALPAQQGIPSAADMALVEYTGDLEKAHSPSFAAFVDYRGRLSSPGKTYAGVARFGEPSQAWFLPAAVYAWGLFSNTSVLSTYKLQPPKDLSGLVAACDTLRNQGLAPIALSDSHGWPLLGWFLQIYLMRNGADSYVDLLSAKRSFTSTEALAGLTELDGWLSKGYFTTNASSIVWTDAFKLLEQGKAAFMLVGGFAASRAEVPGSLSFTLLQEKQSGKAPHAALGSVAGFVFPAQGNNLESALALADKWICDGAPGLTDDGFRVPAVAAPSSSTKGQTDVQTESARALKAGTRIVPLLDAVLSAQAAYDLREAFISWPAHGFGSKDAIRNFAAGLDAILKEGR